MFLYSGKPSPKNENGVVEAKRLQYVSGWDSLKKLIELATPLIPREWSALKPPAWVPQERALRVIVWSMPTSEEQERVQLLVRERTGCPLRVVEGE